MASTQIEIEMDRHNQPSVQLTDVENTNDHTTDLLNDEAGFSLPPTDGGKDAWLLLFACFMLEALIWGMFFTGSMHCDPILISARLSLLLWCLPRIL
jgi:hypothetical protein